MIVRKILFQQIQQLPDILLTKGYGFSAVYHKAGNAHYIIPLPEIREVGQIVDMGIHGLIFRSNPLRSHHQFRTHGAAERYQHLNIRFTKVLDPCANIFVQGLAGACCIVKSQDKGCKLMAAGYTMES